MSIPVLVIGESGNGKSTSLRNLNPESTFLIQCMKKPLPFRAKGWRQATKEGGNVYQTDDVTKILNVMQRAPQDVIVIDDFQAMLTNTFMRRSAETGYQKYTDIGKSAWDVFNAASQLADTKRVYIMAHSTTDETGFVRMRTVGKMVDQYVVPEGFFTIVLRARRVNDQYVFQTQTSGQDCCKSPIGMFSADKIENDLNLVDQAICEFYEISQPA